ncbi:hypothetical protein [Aliterella atlantica]|uniref:Uncharacterized protein n=1 Tax=Aliterella atlantica CENA595 TaxID=1618023 RepID=A0A0D8ZMT8_9CYAN|nr:hypothetical protein [Aliterella atlantica]KJH69662.1 hypothetical protein UH38_22815 [Aliterella atlantica CENA595]
MIYLGSKPIIVAIGVLTIAAQINTSEAANIVTLSQDIEQQAKISLNNTKLNEPQVNKEVYLNKPFTVVPGRAVKLYTKRLRGLVEGIQLNIKNFKINSNGTKIEKISINSFQEHPHKNQKHCSSILISKSTDYTLTPSANESKHSLHIISVGSCKPGMILELLDVTDSGEATVVLKHHRH